MKVVLRVEMADYVARHCERKILRRPNDGHVVSISHAYSGTVVV